MGINLYHEPRLKSPVLIAAWPGIGNIGLMAVETLRTLMDAEPLGEIEPFENFYPRKLVIEEGVLKGLEFPASRFYFKQTDAGDFIFFTGEEQPGAEGSSYAQGNRAYRMASMVLEVAMRFGCRRLYTSGAAVALVHHSSRSRVWAVPNTARLIPEVRSYRNTVLMSEVEGREGQGQISGLNGLLLGVAGVAGLEGICMMGEVPAYLQAFPIPYPKASKSVLEVLSEILELRLDLAGITEVAEHTEREIDRLCESFPAEIREQIDRLAKAPSPEAAEPGPITDQDKQNIMEEIDRFFKRGTKED